MAVLIGNARIDENGNAHGGTAGDSTGKEVQTQNWYSYPWNTVIRPKDSTLAEKIAKSMEYACANNKIGYDQYQRTTLFTAVASLGWKPESIKNLTTAVETDCSALVAVCVNCAIGSGMVSKDIYTGNEAAALMNTGKFQALTDSKYLTSSNYLKRGDILINSVHHTAIVLSNGTLAGTTASTTTTVAKATKVFGSAKTYKNGSTSEPVYSCTNKETKTGELDKYETGYCWGIVNGMYLVCYKHDTDGAWKTGFVEYNGGVTA